MQDLLSTIKAKLSDEEFASVSNIVNKSVVALGTDEAFALRDADGEIRAFKQRVTLSADSGTLIQPVMGGPWAVSAQGYEVLSEATGTCVLFPMNVLVDGEMRPNPYVLRDSDNKRVLSVYCRALAFRFSSKGIPQVADWTTMFDIPSYRMIDLLAKAKKFPTAFRLLPADMSPESGDAGATWARYPFDECTALWINTSHEEALQWYAQIINREKKALDFAQTFARRNAVKHLLGIQKAPGPVWPVTVLCWRPTNGSVVKWDATQYVQLQQRVEGIIRSPGAISGTKAIEMRSGSERISEEMGTAIEHETGDDAGQMVDLMEVVATAPSSNADVEEPVAASVPTTDVPAEKQPNSSRPEKSAGERTRRKPAKPPQEAPEKTHTKEELGILRNFEMAKVSFPEEFALACKKLGISGDSPDVLTAAKICEAVNRIIDSAM